MARPRNVETVSTANIAVAVEVRDRAKLASAKRQTAGDPQTMRDITTVALDIYLSATGNGARTVPADRIPAAIAALRGVAV